MFGPAIQLINWLGALLITIILTIIYVFTAVLSEKNGGAVGAVGSCESCNDENLDSGENVDSTAAVSPLHSTYKFLSFNVEYEAAGYSPDEVVEIINSLGADVIVLNEAHQIEGRVLQADGESPASKISDALSRVNMNHVYSHDWAIIASTRSITQPYKGGAADNKYLDTASLIDGKFYVLSAHLTDYPYQPFQLAHIPYCYDTCQTNICSRPYVQSQEKKSGIRTQHSEKYSACGKTEAEKQMIEQATIARGADIDLIISAINVLRRESLPVLLAGDFNEPSHLDWSDDAVITGQQPLRVRFPSSMRLASAGMTDLFRAVHPDPTKNPGHTWPARPLSYKDLHELSNGKITEQIPTPADRIDFIYGTGVKVLAADVVVTPSDHNAVIAEFEIIP